MPFVREGIEDVRALALPDAIAAHGPAVTLSRTAVVTWRSALQDMLYQVYLNGRYAGITDDPAQRQLVVQLPSSFDSAVAVEVIGVAPPGPHVDFGAELDPPNTNTARVRFTVLRSQSLPIGATLNVYCDNGSGEIDYDEPVNAEPIPVWPCTRDKAGFGTGAFGSGDLGYDSAAAVGLGKGLFGHDLFGLDADVVEWISPTLALGTHRFAVTICDAFGNESTPSETEPITVVPSAKPAAALEVATYDAETNLLTLSIRA